jgi:uncharacterized protein
MNPARPLPALSVLSLLFAWNVAAPAAAPANARPSFNCARVEAKTVPALVCHDAGLAALDRKLAKVYAEAVRKTPVQQPATLRPKQRAWIRERDACEHKHDVRACVETAYRHRIVELEARYALVESTGPVRYACDEDGGEVAATYYKTDPPSLIAEHGDASALMLVVRSGSGAKYESPQGMLWEHQGEAVIRWGAEGTPERHCVKQ